MSTKAAQHPVEFKGTAILYSSLASFPGPRTQAIQCKCHFDDAGTWTLDQGAIRLTISGIEDKVEVGGQLIAALDDQKGDLKLHVTLAGPATGHYDVKARTVSLDISFDFQVFLAPSRLSLHMDSATASTVPAPKGSDYKRFDPASGEITITGKGRFAGGIRLAGASCTILLNGRFTPNPWRGAKA